MIRHTGVYRDGLVQLTSLLKHQLPIPLSGVEWAVASMRGTATEFYTFVRSTLKLGSAWLLAVFSCPFVVAEPSPSVGPNGLNFRRILPQDGLPAAEVRGLLQDQTGFMWVGTYDGLIRYDGARMRTFRHSAKDPSSLANNVVWNILEDGTRNLWIATWSGLDRWDRRTEKFEHHRHDPADPTTISDDVVRILVAGEHGTYWVGTSRGLNHFDPATGKFRVLPESLCPNGLIRLTT